MFVGAFIPMEENTSIETRTVESVKGISNFSNRLLLSILCSVVGLGLLSLLIYKIPNVDFANGYTPYPYNFFYDIYNDSRVGVGLGYYILMPVAICLIMVSGTTILIKNNREKVILILTNLFLYIAPIVMGLIKYYQNDIYYDRNIEQPLGFFPLYLNIFLYVALLIDQTTFLEWIGAKSSDLPKEDRFTRIYRIINASIFAVIYLYTASIPLVGIVTQRNLSYYYMMNHMWTIIGVFPAWFFFGELIRLLVTHSGGRRLVLNTIASGELSLLNISFQLGLKLVRVQRIVRSYIESGAILGILSDDELYIIPKRPDELYAEPKIEVAEKEDEIAKEVLETKMEAKAIASNKFWISVALQIIATGLLTLLICMTPTTILSRIMGGTDPSGNNFFYRWDYTFDIPNWEITRFSPYIGFYILMPIAIVALVVSGFTILTTDKEQSKKLSLINLGLFLIPIIVGYVFGTLISIYNIDVYQYWRNFHGIEFTFLLGIIYFSPFIFILGSMFIEEETFIDWSGFHKKKSPLNRLAIGRIINAILFFLCFIGMWIYPILLCLPMRFASYSAVIFLMSFYIAVLVWWVFGELVKIIVFRNRRRRIIIGIINQGIYDLKTISRRLNIQLNEVQDVTYRLIAEGKIEGTLSDSETKIIPIEKEDTILCEKCKKYNDKDAKFCSHCGATIDRVAGISSSTSTEPTKSMKNDNEYMPRNKLYGIISLIIALLTIPIYSYMMSFDADYYFVQYPILIFMYIGLILGTKSSYYCIGKAGYALNAVGIFPVAIYIFVMLFW